MFTAISDISYREACDTQTHSSSVCFIFLFLVVVGGEVGLGGGQPAGCVVSMETDIPVEVLVRDCPLLSSRNGLKFLCEWP